MPAWFQGQLPCVHLGLRPLLQPRGALNRPYCHPPSLHSAALWPSLPFASRQDGVGGALAGREGHAGEGTAGKNAPTASLWGSVPSGAPSPGEHAMEGPVFPMEVPGQGLSGKTHRAESHELFRPCAVSSHMTSGPGSASRSLLPYTASSLRPPVPTGISQLQGGEKHKGGSCLPAQLLPAGKMGSSRLGESPARKAPEGGGFF